MLAGLGGCRVEEVAVRQPRPGARAGGGGGPAGHGGGAGDQAADQAQQQDGQRVDAAAGRGRDRLGGDRDHGSGAEVALARPDLLHRGLGAGGLRGLEAAEQPVVLVDGRAAGWAMVAANLRSPVRACSTAAWVRSVDLAARFCSSWDWYSALRRSLTSSAATATAVVPMASAALSASTVSAR